MSGDTHTYSLNSSNRFAIPSDFFLNHGITPTWPQSRERHTQLGSQIIRSHVKVIRVRHCGGSYEFPSLSLYQTENSV